MGDAKIYCTYIMASRSHTLYIGVTGDLLKRVFEHKNKSHEGFSSTYNCDRLVYFERFMGPRMAIAREKQLKGWLRAKKIALIEKSNPAWVDLSEGWYGVDPAKRGAGYDGKVLEARTTASAKATASTNTTAKANTTAGPSTAFDALTRIKLRSG
jgi:putative endonuclease